MTLRDLVQLFDLPLRVQKTLSKVQDFAREHADDFFKEEDIASDLYGAVEANFNQIENA